MANPHSSLPLQERVPLRNTLNRFLDLFILTLLISLLCYRLSSLQVDRHGAVWLLAFVCESWFTFVWLLNMNAKWNPVIYKTYPDRLTKRLDDLPAIDMFVTTADPNLEPPIITVNTVLSLLAADYPANKLACYVSDDAASPITFYALSEASKFAKLWVPFCKRYSVGVRAPFVYFTQDPAAPSSSDHDFIGDWKCIKAEYEGLRRRIEDAGRRSTVNNSASILDEMLDGDFSDFRNIERGNHDSIVKVIWKNNELEGAGFPHLIYVAREKRPKHPHHYKAGAMNVLVRVSGVMTNAPFMLNVDCDMFANNPKVLLHGMCLLLGVESEVHSGFVQTMQQFYGALPDDPFGNQLVVLYQKVGFGIGGIQGPFYGGTGCFHRRKIIYGAKPIDGNNEQAKTNGELPYGELERIFGTSKELMYSIHQLNYSKDTKEFPSFGDLSSRTEAAKEVSSCKYELNTNWGKEIGLVYGSMTEDVLTGLRIHSMGWTSAYLIPDTPAFLGNAPVGGPASLTQYKRWSTGLLEILISKNSPVIAVLTKHLLFRTCMAYHFLMVWALRSVFELCYALLPAYCLVTNRSFLPDMSEMSAAATVPAALFVGYNVYNLIEYVQCGLSFRACWNNQRMQRITALTAFLFGFLSVAMKILGLSETVFEVTKKDSGGSPEDGVVDEEEQGRFTFDSSPIFVPATALVLVNMVALGGGLLRVAAGGGGGGGAGVGEFVCSAWVLLCFWPFVRGLFGKGAYGIPWSVVWKAVAVAAAFMQLCRFGSDG